MKPLKILLIFLILFAGCRSTKKIAETSVKTEQSTVTNQSVNSKEAEKVNNDLVTVKKTTTTTTEFYPPETQNTDPETNSITEPDKTANQPKTGPVKSVTTTTVEETQVDKGKTEINKEKQENNNTSAASSTETDIKTKEIKKPLIPLWLWIVGGLAIVAGALFFLNKTPAFAIVKKFLNLK